jgi:5-(carboxyamino)imidazole ribonucleotide synthase
MPETLPPGSTIGILGGGQLGRMLALAAARLGLKTRIYTDERDSPASAVADATFASFTDEAALSAFAAKVDVATCEFENVPARALDAVASRVPVFPSAKSFSVAQDRLTEKDFVGGLGIGVAPYAAVDDEASLREALRRVRPPVLLKTRRFGYDGRGQALLRSEAEALPALEALAGQPAIIEGLVAFERELSVIAVRGQDGGIRFYDVVENVHEKGILASFEARRIAGAIAEALAHVGVLCVEMFEVGSAKPRLLVNEIAPRVHNSGHWTIDACQVSQFENHVRAVAGWPLGDTERHSDALMTNLIGDQVLRWQEIAAEAGMALHIYGKENAPLSQELTATNSLPPLWTGRGSFVREIAAAESGDSAGGWFFPSALFSN